MTNTENTPVTLTTTQEAERKQSFLFSLYNSNSVFYSMVGAYILLFSILSALFYVELPELDKILPTWLVILTGGLLGGLAFVASSKNKAKRQSVAKKIAKNIFADGKQISDAQKELLLADQQAFRKTIVFRLSVVRIFILLAVFLVVNFVRDSITKFIEKDSYQWDALIVPAIIFAVSTLLLITLSIIINKQAKAYLPAKEETSEVTDDDDDNVDNEEVVKENVDSNKINS
jgi:hypothetical protein